MSGLDMFCGDDEKDVQYVQMFIVYIAFLKFPCVGHKLVSCHILLECMASFDECM